MLTDSVNMEHMKNAIKILFGQILDSKNETIKWTS